MTKTVLRFVRFVHW